MQKENIPILKTEARVSDPSNEYISQNEVGFKV